MAGTEELVVLVNVRNEPVGTQAKATVHGADTPLHRGFSALLFRGNGDLLLQQRAPTKKTWPRVWSNSCCGHPGPEERVEDAVRRRVRDELGIGRIDDLRVMLPDYRYRAELQGVVENEICSVLVGRIDDALIRNPDEVEATEWVSWASFMDRVNNISTSLSPWCIEEARLLDALTPFIQWRTSASR